MIKSFLQLIFLGSAFSGYSFDLDFSYGIDSMYRMQVEAVDDYSEGAKLNYTYITQAVSLGVFADLKYLCAGFAIIGNIDEAKGEQYVNDSLEGTEYSSGLSINYLIFDALIKYPIEVGNYFFIFPAVGVRYTHLLREVYGEVQREYTADNAEIKNDLYICFSGGADWNISSKFYLRTLLSADVNLSPTIEFISASEEPIGYALGAKIALGFKL